MKIVEDFFGIDSDAEVTVIEEGTVETPDSQFTFIQLVALMNKMLNEPFDSTRIKTNAITYDITGMDLVISVTPNSKLVTLKPIIKPHD